MRKVLWASVIVAATAIALSVAAWWHWQRFLSPYPDGPARTVEVTVAPGSSAGAILDQLEGAGVLADARLGRLHLVYLRGNPPLQAGDYSFNLPARPTDVIEKLILGDVVLQTVTLVEGLTLSETADLLSRADFGDRERFLAAMNRTDLIDDLDPAATSLEGYVFPDTYSFPRGVREEEIIATAVATFRRVTDGLLDGVAPGQVRDLVTLASLVEKEATLDRERPLISAVYTNRLRIGMGLYADPTIIYGKKLDGTWSGNLTRDDLRRDSPYNTYLRPGLPPSPICSPGRASLLAAAAPADVTFLYFVSRNDGSHVFANTLQEHNRNVDIWQRQYWRKRWAAERAEGSAGAQRQPNP